MMKNINNVKIKMNIKNFDKKKMGVSLKIFGIALLVLFLTIFVNYMYTNIIKPNISTSVSEINELNFVWGENDKEISGDISVWKRATATNKLSKVSLSKKYLRINTTISPSNTDTVIKYYTPYCPSKVEVNSNTVYSNGYSTKSIVGNAYNAFEVQASSSEQSVDIYIYSPLFFNFQAFDISSSKTAMFSINTIGVFISAAMFISALVFVAITAVITRKNKNIGKLCALCLTMLFGFASILLSSIGFNTYQMNSQIFFNLQIIFDILFATSTLFGAYLCCNAKPKFKNLYIALIFLAVLFATLFITSPIALAVITVIFSVLLAVATIYFLIAYADVFVSHKPMSRASATLLIYISLINIYDLITLRLGISTVYRTISAIATTVYVFTMFALMFRLSVNQSVILEERKTQIEENADWFDRISHMLSDLLFSIDALGFATISTDVICDIIKRNEVQELNITTEDEADNLININYSCAIRDDKDNFVEVLNKNITDCDYESIISVFNDEKNADIRFGETYLDIILNKDDVVSMIMHFENYSNGLSDLFKKIMNTAYSNMNTAYQNQNLKNDLVKLQQASIISLAETVEYRSSGTRIHLYAVAEVTKVLCREIGFSQKETDIVSSAAIVHDIGKIAISDDIINGTGSLTEEQLEQVKKHVLFGYNILSKSPGEFMNAAAVIAYQHHEKYNGKGYLGLKGNEIHIYARIVHVADVFDALISKRTYKKGWAPQKVKEYLNEGSGTDFDPSIIDVANKCFDEMLEASNRANEEYKGQL